MRNPFGGSRVNWGGSDPVNRRRLVAQGPSSVQVRWGRGRGTRVRSAGCVEIPGPGAPQDFRAFRWRKTPSAGLPEAFTAPLD
ncbi:hypothetical protein STTU_1578 [Streptomyces sp. Tu6071]|nr:hypothetical protein CAC01_07120 [Streptomyces sp. CLI2509]EGJ74366.1 hypothetical protein STTU_1578 [Streptomyces sp. Tu6071]